MNLGQLKEILPFLIPFVVVELGLFTYTLRHILTHKNYKRGSRRLWLIVAIVGINLVGPILYLTLGKEDE
ncbi:MAG: PLDc N-terminal domain-containing protein [Lachnospiraceae bacterium]|nr:PLDc N-terminal domain-containing protein [Lachnospiraceae bacterium]